MPIPKYDPEDFQASLEEARQAQARNTQEHDALRAKRNALRAEQAERQALEHDALLAERTALREQQRWAQEHPRPLQELFTQRVVKAYARVQAQSPTKLVYVPMHTRALNALADVAGIARMEDLSAMCYYLASTCDNHELRPLQHLVLQEHPDMFYAHEHGHLLGTTSWSTLFQSQLFHGALSADWSPLPMIKLGGYFDAFRAHCTLTTIALAARCAPKA